MKIIDLLNKIANGEEVPDYIIWEGRVYEKDLETDYTCYSSNGEPRYFLNEVLLNQLNEEIEVIEEDKNIEKLDIAWQNAFDEQVQQDCVKMILNKINEIIDKINKMEEK